MCKNSDEQKLENVTADDAIDRATGMKQNKRYESCIGGVTEIDGAIPVVIHMSALHMCTPSMENLTLEQL